MANTVSIKRPAKKIKVSQTANMPVNSTKIHAKVPKKSSLAIKQTSQVKKGSTVKMALNTKAPKVLKGRVPKGTKIRIVRG